MIIIWKCCHSILRRIPPDTRAHRIWHRKNEQKKNGAHFIRYNTKYVRKATSPQIYDYFIRKWLQNVDTARTKRMQILNLIRCERRKKLTIIKCRSRYVMKFLPIYLRAITQERKKIILHNDKIPEESNLKTIIAAWCSLFVYLPLSLAVCVCVWLRVLMMDMHTLKIQNYWFIIHPCHAASAHCPPFGIACM